MISFVVFLISSSVLIALGPFRINNNRLITIDKKLLYYRLDAFHVVFFLNQVNCCLRLDNRRFFTEGIEQIFASRSISKISGFPNPLLYAIARKCSQKMSMFPIIVQQSVLKNFYFDTQLMNC